MLEWLTSDVLGTVKHGFFTRKGGASSGVFEGLNCGQGSSDQADIVAINRMRVAQEMGVAPGALQSVHQVHSADVVIVTDPSADRPKADGMVTRQPGIALSVLSADCQPVLFHDADAGVIGAAHAGWKGAQSGVLGATVDQMEALGAQRRNITAVIGPCISQRHYEVGQEFFESFADEDPGFTRFFVNGAPGKYQFDLPGFGLHMLRSADVGRAEWVGACTYADPGRFFSYRRSTHEKAPDYGRLISSIRL